MAARSPLFCARFVFPVVWVAARAATAPSSYELSEAYVGKDFFSKFDFWSQPDPTHGQVKYVDVTTANAEGLAWATQDSVYMGVDMAEAGAGGERNSVRVQSKAVYDSGLFIIDVEHMPTGCGTWPAFWMYGEDQAHLWPTWGEFDMIEAVHNRSSISTTLHTGPGCTQTEIKPGVHFSQAWQTSTSGALADNCDVSAPNQDMNQGCAQHGRKASSGKAFNSQSGGTFAAEWDPSAGYIRMWFWPSGSVPDDVLRRVPMPQFWGQPDSFFSLAQETCAADHFHNMRLVFNIDLCGDLGSPTFAESCPQEAKTMTCEQFIADPMRMSEAYWMLRGLDVYTRSDVVAFAMVMDEPLDQPGQSFFTSSKAIAILLLGVSMLVCFFRVELQKLLGVSAPWAVGIDVEDGRADEVSARRYSLTNIKQLLAGYLPGTVREEPQPRARRTSSMTSIASDFLNSRGPDGNRGRSDSANSVTSFLSDWSRPRPETGARR